MPLPELPARATEALGGLVARFGMPAGAEASLARLVSLLAFNASAPTAVRDVERVINDHIADSLVALELEAVRSAVYAADIGSGAGLPGLPLAIALPDARFVLLESNRRKAAFLSAAASECGLRNVEVVAERAEDWRAGIGSRDLVTARAVADLAVLAEYAAPLLRLGGAMVAWRGAPDPQVEAQAGRAAQELGLRVLPAIRVTPYPAARQRHLHVMLKASETPERFPRRPGMAAKRPLGGGSPLGVCGNR
jgi:16S rRNA (guanine527-N7)-methyltransferase